MKPCIGLRQEELLRNDHRRRRRWIHHRGGDAQRNPFQTLATKNHVGQWSYQVGNFVIE